jgi:hypothetical protein
MEDTRSEAAMLVGIDADRLAIVAAENGEATILPWRGLGSGKRSGVTRGDAHRV